MQLSSVASSAGVVGFSAMLKALDTSYLSVFRRSVIQLFRRTRRIQAVLSYKYSSSKEKRAVAERNSAHGRVKSFGDFVTTLIRS